MVRRTFEYLDSNVMRRLYTSLIRPHLEFNNVAWSPRLIKDQKLLEAVQRRATKLVPELKNMDYEDRLAKMNLPSLYYRRQRGDMIEVDKYLHDMYTVGRGILELQGPSRTRGHSLRLKKKFCKTALRKHYFSNRVVNPWNSLPESVIAAPSLNSFKAGLDRYWIGKRCEVDQQQ